MLLLLLLLLFLGVGRKHPSLRRMVFRRGGEWRRRRRS
jgi:hypothetical protein